jgi:signal peptidase II
MQAARGAALNALPEASDPPGRRRLGLLLAVAGSVYAADAISKIIVVAALSHRVVHVVDGVLVLRVLRNSGAAFSIGTSMTIVFTLIAVGVIFFILRTSRQLRSLPWAITLGLLLGGATGNLTDRLLRSPGLFRGDVVDWIQLPHWPVFNVADSAIVCGGVLAVLLAAGGYRLDGTRDGHGGTGGRGTGPHGRGGAGGPPPRQADDGQPDQPDQPSQAREWGTAAGDSRA